MWDRLRQQNDAYEAWTQQHPWRQAALMGGATAAAALILSYRFRISHGLPGWSVALIWGVGAFTVSGLLSFRRRD